MRSRLKVTKLLLAASAAVALAAGPLGTVSAQSMSAERQQEFTQAAQEFHVPAQLLLSIGYNESRWETHAGASDDGGYGLMDLTTNASHASGRDGHTVTAPNTGSQTYTLDQATTLLHESATTLKTNETQNIRGAAAVIAADAKALNNGQLPASTDQAAWYAATAKYTGSSDSQTAEDFADSVYSTLRSGEQVTTQDGQRLSLTGSNNYHVDRSKFNHLSWKTNTAKNSSGAECPSDLNCRFIPAAYAQTSSTDPTVYGNYDHANRPKDMQIKYIVIHDTEGSYDSAIQAFQNPGYEVSANYVIRSSDGAITQMVRNSDVAWGAADWYVNMHAINIEHEGYAASGSAWYTEKMYESSAKLVRYLAAQYHIPLDRQHIIGHENVPALTQTALAAQHTDPGPYWDWNHYMALLQGRSDTQEQGMPVNAHAGETVTVAPSFSANQQTFEDCSSGTCVNLPTQGSSYVPLHTQPDATSPLLGDPYTKSPGTTDIADWGTTANSGEQFVVAKTEGDWTGINYGGTVGWYYDPRGAAHVSHAAYALEVKPKGTTSVNVYGGAYPESSVYPASVPQPSLQVLYTIPNGQSYALADANVPTDYFYDETANYSMPYDHVIFHGKERYYQITFNHRTAFVKASDVTLTH